MNHSDITFSGQQVSVADQTWQSPWPVQQAKVIAGRVILIYDYMAGPRFRQFQNLEAFSFSGQRLWTAEHPTSETTDAYVEILSAIPFVIWNFAGYRCELDSSNGRLMKAEFTK
jgi:hypothetical protein